MPWDGFSGANDVFIPAEYREAALAAIVELARGQREGKDYGSWLSDTIDELRRATGLSDALFTLGWEIGEDATGNVTSLVCATSWTSLTFASMRYLEAIAPYVRDGSFIHFFSAYENQCLVYHILFNQGYFEMRDEGTCTTDDAMLEHIRPKRTWDS